jgi:hypothetical protein
MSSLTLTYAELAVRLGRSEAGAKSLAKRKRWKRTVGNDGLTRITIDESEVAELANPDRRGIGRPPANSTRAKAVEPGSNSVRSATEPRPNPVHDLQARLAVAEALGTERKEAFDRERERADALTRDLVSAREEIGVLRERLDRSVAELAAMHDRLTAAQTEHVAELTVLHERMARAECDRSRVAAELAAHLSLPWWRRLFG